MINQSRAASVLLAAFYYVVFVLILVDLCAICDILLVCGGFTVTVVVFFIIFDTICNPMSLKAALQYVLLHINWNWIDFVYLLLKMVHFYLFYHYYTHFGDF